MVNLSLQITGMFSVLLGFLHFTFPRRFGFRELLGGTGPEPPDFRLGPYRQRLSRADVLGIVHVMNHAASFAILSIGVFDLFVTRWSDTAAGRLVSAWAAAFWWLRALAQLHLGRRRGDLLVMAGFGLLGAVQLLPFVFE